MNAATIPLRNPRTVGTCGAPGCHSKARLFACGWRCSACAPQPRVSAA